MREELDKKLCEDFPNLYADRYASEMETCMCWGFPADGWYNIIRDLSEKLEALIVAMPEEERGNYKCAQCKEKFGGLRFYMTYETKEISDLIREAEKKSYTTCEFCGEPGKMRNPRGWLITLCDSCHEKREIERESKSK